MIGSRYRDYSNEPFDVAARLAKMLRDCEWYHRTSVLETFDNGTPLGTWLNVWGEGERPAELPKEFDGYPILFSRVTKQSPCPFGSVKP